MVRDESYPCGITHRVKHHFSVLGIYQIWRTWAKIFLVKCTHVDIRWLDELHMLERTDFSRFWGAHIDSSEYNADVPDSNYNWWLDRFMSIAGNTLLLDVQFWPRLWRGRQQEYCRRAVWRAWCELSGLKKNYEMVGNRVLRFFILVSKHVIRRRSRQSTLHPWIDQLPEFTKSFYISVQILLR